MTHRVTVTTAHAPGASWQTMAAICHCLPLFNSPCAASAQREAEGIIRWQRAYGCVAALCKMRKKGVRNAPEWT